MSTKSVHGVSTRGFTLVEMLAVLAIMAILAVLAVTSVSSLRSERLTTAGNQLVDVFAMARQNSISNNDFTAVIFQTQGTMACRAYCLVELARQNDGTLATTWTQVTTWKFLPGGVVVENVPSLQSTTDTYMGSPVSSTVFPFTQVTLTPPLYQGSAITGTVTQCFQPDGTMIGEQSLQLRLVEGTADSTTGNTTYQEALTGGVPVNYYDIFFIGNTGTTKIARS